jgi:hypothetical protein
MKAKILIESSTAVDGLFVRVQAEGLHVSNHIASYANGAGLAQIGGALNWAKDQLRERGYEVGKVQYDISTDQFEIEVEKVQKKPKASEIRKALRPLFGDSVDARNFDIYLEHGLGGDARVEFYGHPVGNEFPDLEIEVDE